MRSRFRPPSAYALLLCLLPLVGILSNSGCSGGSDSITPLPSPTGSASPSPTPTPSRTPVAVKTGIIWGARSRQAAFNDSVGGPSSALSAIITFKGARAPGQDLTYTVDRGVQSGKQVYSSEPVTAIPGTYTLVVDFFSETGGRGVKVGTAQSSATIQDNGDITTTIVTEGTIKSVEVPASQLVRIGETKALVFSAKDSSGNTVAISPGSAFVTVTSGGDKLTAQGEEITGVAPNRATVTVRVDNALSPATEVIIRSNVQVAVSPNPATISYGLTQQFTAAVQNDGPSGQTGVTWELSDLKAGTIAADGTFTATKNNANKGVYRVIARSVYDPDITASADVEVKSLIGITITPAPTAQVSIKATQQFTAALTNIPAGEDAGVTWVVEGGNANGTISPAGVYTSPATPGIYNITARSKFDPETFLTFSVDVRSFVNVTVNPNPIPTLSIRQVQPFSATVTGVPAGGNTGVDFALEAPNGGNPGTLAVVNANNVNYTAPAQPGNFVLVVTPRFDPRPEKQVRISFRVGAGSLPIVVN